MTDKFRNTYRIYSHRKPGWDYSSEGHYFITLVVQHRYKVLGWIEADKMNLNEWGKIVLNEWNKSFEIRTELFCDVFVIMPNHIHAIVTIKNMKQNDGPPSVIHSLERKPKSISSFVAGFKSETNRAIDDAIDGGYDIFPELGKFNRNNHFWQPNYHDHIIRNEKTYAFISNYINLNPAKWEEDKFIVEGNMNNKYGGVFWDAE